MKTKIFLVILCFLMICSLFVICSARAYGDSNKPTILTDRFLIDAFNAPSITVGRIKLTAKYKGSSQSEQFQQYEKKALIF